MDDIGERPPWTWRGPWGERVVATAIHAGHDVRPALAELMTLPDDVRRREEDPFTDEISALMPSTVAVHRSRFEVDLNRARAESVYRTPADCWDLEVWRSDPLDAELAEASRRLHDRFYAELGERLDRIASTGPFVVFDVHSYNHRRHGADLPPQPAAENPDVNVGTGSLDRERFGGVVDAFMSALASTEVGRTGGADGAPLDIRENVRFRGAHLAAWVHERYPGVGCVLALEFKKTFMDEWTGEADSARIETLARALVTTVPALELALSRLDP